MHPVRRNDSLFNRISFAEYVNLTKPAQVRNTSKGGIATIDIDGYIGRDLLREQLTGEKSVNTSEVIKETLRGIKAREIIVNINSPGGNLNDGLMIRNHLLAKKAKVITNLLGFSASAATVIAQAGDVRRMPQTSFQLLHRSMFGICGYLNRNSFEAYAKDCRVIDNDLIKIYARKSGKPAAVIEKIMDEGGGYGRWIGAEESLKLGLIDDIYDPADESDSSAVSSSSTSPKNQRQRQVELLALGVKKETNQSNSESGVMVSLSTPPQPANLTERYKLKQVAHHEAGHAVIALCLGFNIQQIQVWVSDTKRGLVTIKPSHTGMSPFQRAAIAVAGPMAKHGYREGKAAIGDFGIDSCSSNSDVLDSDEAIIHDCLESIEPKKRDDLKNRVEQYTQSRLRMNWDLVQSLGDHLSVVRSMNEYDVERWFTNELTGKELYV